MEWLVCIATGVLVARRRRAGQSSVVPLLVGLLFALPCAAWLPLLARFVTEGEAMRALILKDLSFSWMEVETVVVCAGVPVLLVAWAVDRSLRPAPK